MSFHTFGVGKVLQDCLIICGRVPQNKVSSIKSVQSLQTFFFFSLSAKTSCQMDPSKFPVSVCWRTHWKGSVGSEFNEFPLYCERHPWDTGHFRLPSKSRWCDVIAFFFFYLYLTWPGLTGETPLPPPPPHSHSINMPTLQDCPRGGCGQPLKNASHLRQKLIGGWLP